MVGTLFRTLPLQFVEDQGSICSVKQSRIEDRSSEGGGGKAEEYLCYLVA